MPPTFHRRRLQAECPPSVRPSRARIGRERTSCEREQEREWRRGPSRTRPKSANIGRPSGPRRRTLRESSGRTHPWPAARASRRWEAALRFRSSPPTARGSKWIHTVGSATVDNQRLCLSGLLRCGLEVGRPDFPGTNQGPACAPPFVAYRISLPAPPQRVRLSLQTGRKQRGGHPRPARIRQSSAAHEVRGNRRPRQRASGANRISKISVFDGEAVPLSDVADTRIEESVAALREFVAEHGSLPTADSWTEAAMRPSEKTIRRRFGSFREAIQRAAP